ncbi:glycoside hydrolase family 3 protein [Yimella sp. cx-573]|nr:glycoside hydrolase family 3 protein [Yimella sp. cx-573]
MSTSSRALRSVAVLAALSVTACSGAGNDAGQSSTGSASTQGLSPTSSTSKPSASKTTAAQTTGCVDRLVSSMTPAQRAGQLVMVGLDASTQPSSLDSLIADSHIGNMFFIGGWKNSANVLSAAKHVQAQANPSSTAGVRFLVAADQEGGQVQQLKGSGFTRLPSALAQGAMSPADRTNVVNTLVRELKTAGVNMDLAPVADTVPPENPRSNEPIGRWGRQYGNDPAAAGAAVTDVVRTMQTGGLQSTLKHFPGLGRITGNTDFTASGISDGQTTADDDYLRPFKDGIAAGAPVVMMSSAYYPKLDATNQAIYSPKIIDGLLRQQLGFDGVVISDDLNAVAVRGIPAGERAVRMVRAGGDIALTGLASAAPIMAKALVTEAARDPEFQRTIDTSAKRVLTLKTRAGLTSCSAG